jgi:hypothetical protein
MNLDRIEAQIDDKILSRLILGDSLDNILKNLKRDINKFSSRKSFVFLSKKYLIKNWNLIPIRKKYTVYYVIHSSKRLDDIEWLIKNREKLPKLDNSKLFKLIQLKDRLR